MKETREKLAEYAHEAWTGWMEYLFSEGAFNDDGTWTMPKWAVERWQRQTNTKYKDLSDDEKKSDRAEADKMIGIVADDLAYLIVTEENGKGTEK